MPFSDAFAKCQLRGVISLITNLPSSQSGSFTVTHSTFCNQTRSLRPCCLCLPSFCHRSLAEIVHSLSPAAHRKECRQSRCQFHQGEVPGGARKVFNKKAGLPWWLRHNLPAMQEIWVKSLVGEIPWRRECNSLQYSCLENPHGQKSLAGPSS